MATLPSGCAICGKQQGLLRCTACKVALYCTRDHQIEHRNQHKSVCTIIRRQKHILESKEQMLREWPEDDPLCPPDPFTNAVGHFWQYFPTHDYIWERYRVAQAMAKIQTKESLQLQLDNYMDMFRLCGGDRIGIHNIVPSLMLRLGKDQECYDFIKSWFVAWGDSTYDWENMPLPYLNLEKADAFEECKGFYPEWSLAFIMDVFLLKVKLILDLKALENVELACGRKLPREIVDIIKSYVPESSIIRSNMRIVSRLNHVLEIRKLERQTDMLGHLVGKYNPNYWYFFASPRDEDLEETHCACTKGSAGEAREALQDTYFACIEIPGAMEFIAKRAGLKEWYDQMHSISLCLAAL